MIINDTDCQDNGQKKHRTGYYLMHLPHAFTSWCFPNRTFSLAETLTLAGCLGFPHGETQRKKSKLVSPFHPSCVSNLPKKVPSLYLKAKMASRTFIRALRSNVVRQIATPVQRRTIATAFIAARATVAVAPRIPALIQKRGIKTIDFAGVKEDVYGMSIATECRLCPLFNR